MFVIFQPWYPATPVPLYYPGTPVPLYSPGTLVPLVTGMPGTGATFTANFGALSLTGHGGAYRCALNRNTEMQYPIGDLGVILFFTK